MQKIILTHAQVTKYARALAERIRIELPEVESFRTYGVPRGGIPVTYLLAHYLNILPVDSPEDAHIIVDDIVDSGATASRFEHKPFYALIVRKELDESLKDAWFIFPWDGSSDNSASDIPIRLLQYIGEDPNRGGLLETPKRFLKAWDHYASGYNQAPADVLKVFEDGAERVDEMVLVRGIPVYSHCEHHLAPFFGTAMVGYIPNGRIVGLSKLSRLVDIFARRLQVQERLTNQIADALVEHLAPKGVGVVIRCRHLCMEARGVQRQGTDTVTSAMRGVLKDDHNARSEFLQLRHHDD